MAAVRPVSRVHSGRLRHSGVLPGHRGRGGRHLHGDVAYRFLQARERGRQTASMTVECMTLPRSTRRQCRRLAACHGAAGRPVCSLACWALAVVNPIRPLPFDTCVLKSITGWPCPTCGLRAGVFGLRRHAGSLAPIRRSHRMGVWRWLAHAEAAGRPLWKLAAAGRPGRRLSDGGRVDRPGSSSWGARQARQAASTSAIVFGIGGPSTRAPVPVTITSSSIRQPRASLNFSTSA